jgi:hypothetical protein
VILARSASFYGGRSIKIINLNSLSVIGHFIKVDFNWPTYQPKDIHVPIDRASFGLAEVK